jgi:hypothetical protein
LYPGVNVDPEGFPFDLRVGATYDSDTGQHGTCLFSKIFGEDYGVSKRASVTVVVLPQGVKGLSEDASSRIPPFRYRTVTDALDLILQDVLSKKIQNRAVVSMAIGFPIGGVIGPSLNRLPVLGDPLFPMYQAVQALIDQGVVIVTLSGNAGFSRFGVSPNPPFIFHN